MFQTPSPSQSADNVSNQPLQTVQPIGRPGAEEVAVEIPIALSVNGISQAVMLATPQDLEDFAIGFSLAEGWIRRLADVLDIEVIEQPNGIELALQVLASCEHRLKLRNRQLVGRTGCGLCGVASLAELDAVQPAQVPLVTVREDALVRAFAALKHAQPLNARCGGLHAAAWFQESGELITAREDIGRHNALDKVTGAIARSDRGGLRTDNGFILMSSRASHELVHKTAMAGIGLLACVSAPSSMAIASAERLGLQLWAFVRNDRATRYA
ncbi:MAG: formate dehydrogenase accessory sulfurtransferase FdhD [Burkholderiales bacterium]|nr:formate dehydrogenase accessory sulfurtransferase FdhD [Burkholderiales bacterium]